MLLLAAQSLLVFSGPASVQASSPAAAAATLPACSFARSVLGGAVLSGSFFDNPSVFPLGWGVSGLPVAVALEALLPYSAVALLSACARVSPASVAASAPTCGER
jgi:hypothetical protein